MFRYYAVVRTVRCSLPLFDEQLRQEEENAFRAGVKTTKMAIGQKYQHIHIIMLTVKGQDEDEELGYQCGANEYITKPFSPNMVVARLKNIRTAGNSL